LPLFGLSLGDDVAVGMPGLLRFEHLLKLEN